MLAVLVAVALGGGLVAAWQLRGGRGPGKPEKVAAGFFAAWRKGSLDGMRDLVADPPGDFADRYRALSRTLAVTSVDVEPRPVVRSGASGRSTRCGCPRSRSSHATARRCPTPGSSRPTWRNSSTG
ncbi:hypothetical protein [Actinomadura opuntiae]|uniref:hypothetical protein n=1 Tax=Actinomadura sp. OS1-43 TaxID=604315 RepID=UPI00255A8A39|nr:hypothetical protein [Actinomadura sp. OS1-43]MDL4819886.1 hypothetical protein [Actinomadura sp. OS1-43]